MNPATKRWSVGLGVVALGAGAFFALRPRPHDRPVSPVTADVDEPPAPYRDRQYPRPLAEAPAPVPVPAMPAPPPPEVPASREPATPVAVPTIADDRPPPATPQTASRWIAGYRDAVCGCKTRNCVRELQGRFLNALSSMSYDDARDGQRYQEASHEAIRCYAALPDDS
jgi:hypothetical protein